MATVKCEMQEEQAAEAKLSTLQDVGNEQDCAQAEHAFALNAGQRREVEAKLHACEHKISMYTEEVGMQQLYTDPAARQLSLVGMQMEECVQDWTLEMLMISERKAQNILVQNSQLEAEIRQLRLARANVEGQKTCVDSALGELDQKMKLKLVEIEQLKRDLATSYRSRDKLDQEIAALKEKVKQQAIELKDTRRELEAAKQRIMVL